MEVEYRSGYNNSGRKPGMIDYRFVSYNDKDYVVGTILKNGMVVEFVFDKEDYDAVSQRAWHVQSNNYIASAFCCESDGKRRELYLHNLVMNRDFFPGKGAKESVDHINRNGFDNRKENLRIISQSQQNINQTKKKRNVVLPTDSGIQPDEIPKHIWYVRAQGQHGDRFAIEFKSENICWKGTSSKKVSLKEKLEEAKKKLTELYLIYPHLNPDAEKLKIERLNKSFAEIISRVEQNIENIESSTENIQEKTLPQSIVPAPTTNTTKATSPKQWKISNIWSAFQAGKENNYKSYLESDETIKGLEDWQTRWTNFSETIQSSNKETAEPIIKKFIGTLRIKRQQQMPSQQIDRFREEKDVWKADDVVRALKEEKLALFKAFIEKKNGENTESEFWKKSWSTFEKNLREADDSTKKKVVSNFMAAQRIKRNRRGKVGES